MGENIQQIIGNIGLVVMRDVSFQDVFLGKMEPIYQLMLLTNGTRGLRVQTLEPEHLAV